MPTMTTITSAERDDFLRRDRERQHRIASGQTASTALRASQTQSREHDAEAQSDPSASGGQGRTATSGLAGKDDSFEENDEAKEEGDLDYPEPEPLQLPESTYTLLFTQPVFSLPFAYATAVYGISTTCLAMALINALKGGSEGNLLSAPANVATEVRIAEYLAIIITLLMEEEIPTALFLLRRINSSSFRTRFPNKSYTKFVCSAGLRIFLGYLFLANAYVIIVQSEAVVDIFFNALALQFLQQLDDISFELAKKDVLGRTIQNACTAKLFRTEFKKEKLQLYKNASLILKSVYFLNLAGLLAGMISVSMRQTSGYYQCDSITVDLGDEFWDEAVEQISPGEFKKDELLMFSSFNGVYKKSGIHAGRPVYTEARKSDGEEFGSTVIPAEIRYNGNLGAWTFSHPNIWRSPDEHGWLLRSTSTTEYDILEVNVVWSIWRGVVSDTTVSYSCNSCSHDSDCNVNGKCEESKCVCGSRAGIEYMGTHCDVKLKESCESITSEGTNTTFSIQYHPEADGQKVQAYNRPIYNHVGGLVNASEEDLDWLFYTGQRWVRIGRNLREENKTLRDVQIEMGDYHAFWNEHLSLTSSNLFLISDSTTSSSPVGVDWYSIGEQGDQFGPFGALSPVQKGGQAGRGLFRCAGKFTEP